jgi:hypothetical protein
MTTRRNLSEHVQIDTSGRVTLSDEELDTMLTDPDTVLAGGDGQINNYCTNTGDCRETTNTIQCTNTMACDDSLNPIRHCKMPNDVPGG